MMNETIELTDKEKNFLNELKEIIGDSNLKKIYVARPARGLPNKAEGYSLDEFIEKHKVKTLEEIVVGIKNGFYRGLIYTDKHFISTQGLEIVTVSQK